MIKTLIRFSSYKGDNPQVQNLGISPVMDRWQSGQMRRSWKPMIVNSDPGVRIPFYPLNLLRVRVLWHKEVGLGAAAIAGTAGLAYGAKKLYDKKKKEE